MSPDASLLIGALRAIIYNDGGTVMRRFQAIEDRLDAFEREDEARAQNPTACHCGDPDCALGLTGPEAA